MKDKCFICLSKSSQEFKDHQNVVSVRCSSQECGNYEISERAIRYLEKHLYAKENIQPFVRKCTLENKIADLYFDSDDFKLGVIGEREKGS